MTNRIQKYFDRIHNVQHPAFPRDFRANAVGFLILVLLGGLGLLLAAPRLAAGGVTGQLFTWLLLKAAGLIVASGLILVLVPLWGLLTALLLLVWTGAMLGLGAGFVVPLSLFSCALLLAASVQMAQQWEKAVVLRLGRFQRLAGPGLFLLAPLIDRVTRYVDTRIRATDFTAAKTVTRDTVPVHVDALAFWMIWDPKRAILEVENYLEAVVLSAQTALRDAIGGNNLAALLSERERLGREIQETLDRKTNPWGITILSIEITDIILPKELEDAMSRQAQAERERQSRVILSRAEVEVSEHYIRAADRYRDDPTALHLRAMNMIYEGIQKNGTIVLLPSSGVSTMSLGSMLDDLAVGKLPAGKTPPPGGAVGGQTAPAAEPETKGENAQ
jgi:regulator of protease activity HflC (stomatin/prohibitin superfamily)